MSEFPENQKIILLFKNGQNNRNEWKGKVKRMTENQPGKTLTLEELLKKLSENLQA